MELVGLPRSPGDDEPQRIVAELSPGTLIGGTYRIVRLLGRGGMGVVYEVEHLRLGRRFALKILRGLLDRDAVQRFRRESRVLSALDSEHVVAAIDTGELAGDVPYLVLELLRGKDLRRLLLEEGPLPIPRAVSLVSQACHGLEVAHRAGIIHRDLKPENVFVVRMSSGGELCKLLDFGIAKSAASNSTDARTLIGTIKYMAPEQLADAGGVQASTDVRALGMILYECLCGHLPYAGESTEHLVFHILNEAPRSIRSFNSSVPPELGDVLQRALARDPEARFQSARELREALAPFLFSREHGSSRSLDTTARLDSERLENVAGAAPEASGRTQFIRSLIFGIVIGAGLSLVVQRIGSEHVAVGATLASSGIPPIPERAGTGAPTALPASWTMTSTEMPSVRRSDSEPSTPAREPAAKTSPSRTAAAARAVPLQPAPSTTTRTDRDTTPFPSVPLERQNPYDR